jgi:hypothetical protein
MGYNEGGEVHQWFTAGLFVLGGFGVAQLGFPKAGSDDPILCDDEVMGPGDVCMSMSGGSSTSHSYEELHAEKLAGHGWELTFVVIGGLMLAAGLLSLAYLVRAARRP